MKRIVFMIAMFAATVSAESLQPNAQYCLVCHGSNAQGNVAIQAPNLTVLPEWYLQKQLNGFRAGWRGGHGNNAYSQEMMAVAKVMTEAEMSAALAFIRSFTPVAAKAVGQGDQARGKALYQQCQSCHGENGAGVAELQAPPLAGQHSWYLQRQLEAFRHGERGIDSADVQGQMMRQVALGLNQPADIQDLVAYISSIKE